MSELFEARIRPSTTTGDVLTTIDDPDFPGEKVPAWGTAPGGTPSGAAGGDLAGTYPNPTIGSAGMEAVRDMLASVLIAGSSRITVVPSDGSDTITFDVSVEAVQDIIGALVADGSGIDAVYDDAGNLVTIQLGPITVNAQTGTSYTLVLTDAPKGVTMSNAAASTLTVPPNSSVAFPVGTRIPGMQIGAGQVTITPGAGVTVHATPGLKVAAQYGAFELWKIGTDEWVAYGRLSA